MRLPLRRSPTGDEPDGSSSSRRDRQSRRPHAGACRSTGGRHRDYSIRDWPLDYNYNNEQHRFGNVARLWNQIYEPGSDERYVLMDEFLELGYGIDPTMTIYEASRDVMRAREAEWHD